MGIGTTLMGKKLMKDIHIQTPVFQMNPNNMSHKLNNTKKLLQSTKVNDKYSQ